MLQGSQVQWALGSCPCYENIHRKKKNVSTLPGLNESEL